jgi:3-deoxy-D-manno-octulosonic-acid transferase
MYLLYTFFLAAGLLITSPYYLLRFRRYGPSLKHRFGRIDIPQLQNSVWIHAVSVGEVRAVLKLVERLRALYPKAPLVLSTITPAGQQLARSAQLADHVFYFPFDLPGAIRRTLNRVGPQLVIVAETEIWPNFLRECRKREIRVMMVNGRISDRSLPRYRLIRGWLKRVLDDYTVLGMQSEMDRRRIEMIGANSAKVTVFGNLKYDAPPKNGTLEPALSGFLRDRRPLWIAASTTAGEEELVLTAFAQLRVQHPTLQLMIAPRHPDRFETVARLIKSRGHECAPRTQIGLGVVRSTSAEIVLLDSIGELASTFQYADVVFMGGTLVPRGGHNILEPAAWAKPIVFGRHMENFREISELFLEARAAIQVNNAEELADAVDRLLSDRRIASELGANAQRIVERNTGATERVLAFLQPAGAAR